MQYKFLAFLCLFFSSHLFGSTTLFCSHPELCSLVKQLTSTPSESLVNITGDPHEFEPSIQEIKKLLTTPFLITGPTELNPWIKKIVFQRSKIPSLKTISITFDQTDYQSYANANGDVLSHFWLYPKVYCSLKNKMAQELKRFAISVTENSNCDAETISNKLSKTLSQISLPIILTHDALLPLFLSLNNAKDKKIIAIKGSGHHSEISPDAIKNMYGALSSKKVIWIKEDGINIPQNIVNKIRANDIVLSIDTSKTKSNTPFSILLEINDKLLPYSQSRFN